jgi:hypothetical protein
MKTKLISAAAVMVLTVVILTQNAQAADAQKPTSCSF